MASYYPMKDIPSVSTLLSSYAALSTFVILFRSLLEQLLPRWFRELLVSKFSDLVSSRFSSDFTFVMETERWQTHETFRAAEVYLPTKIGPSTSSLQLLRTVSADDATPEVAVTLGSKIVDEFEGIRLTWTLESRKTSDQGPVIKFFNLTCNKKHREKVLTCYFPHVIRTARAISDKKKGLKIYTYTGSDGDWDRNDFNHPATFETLAMDPERKDSIIKDLDMFASRRSYFQSVGRAWKRGYLLYGPPGTGKSTMVAAIANYMKYDIYDLQFASVKSDIELRNILTSTTNRSILLVEDIDCSCKASHDREKSTDDKKKKKGGGPLSSEVTLSGLLNFIDGLWSSCGDERIIIFTTNYKERLDQALLRPGRMDVHIYMGYCTPSGFKMLTGMYLGIKNHMLFELIERLVEKIDITPAEVAQQLMATNKPDISLQGLIEFLNAKKKAEEGKEDDAEKEKGGGENATEEKKVSIHIMDETTCIYLT